MKNVNHTVLSFLGIVALSMMLISCYSLWDDLNTLPVPGFTSKSVTLQAGDIALTYDDSDPEKFVFTADTSALGLNDDDVVWFVNGVQKGTGETLEMNYSDYSSDVYQVSASVTEGIRTYTAQASVKFDLISLYRFGGLASQTNVYIRGNKLVFPFDLGVGMLFGGVVKKENPVNNPDNVDAVTGEKVYLIRYEKRADYGVYAGEKDLYVDGSGNITIAADGNTPYGKKGSYYKGYDTSAGENSDYDMILLKDGENTYLFPLILEVKEENALDYKLVPLTDSPLLYKDKKQIKYQDDNYAEWSGQSELIRYDLYQESEGYMLIGGEKYYILETVQYNEELGDEPPPP